MQSMDEVYREYAGYVYSFLLAKTHDADLAEELTQETFYQAVKNINKYNGSCKITTWLCAIAKKQLSVYLRKNPTPAENEVLMAANSPEQLLISAEDKIDLYRRLHICPEPFREILYLRIFAGLSFQEIGDIFGKSGNWARVTFYRGKEKLKKEWEDNE